MKHPNTLLCLQMTQLMIRLMLRITTEELDRPSPFTSHDCTLVDLVKALDYFHEHHPSHRPLDDTPFSAVKTITLYTLNVGYDTVVQAMRAAGISPTSRLWKLVHRLHEPKSDAPSGVSNDLHLQIVHIIEEIPASADKQVTVGKLYNLLREHKELDVEHYLGRLSVTFQNYVRETLGIVAQESEVSVSKRIGDENSSVSADAETLRQRLETVRARQHKTEPPLSAVADNVAARPPVDHTSKPTSNISVDTDAKQVEVQVQGLYDRMHRINERLKTTQARRPSRPES